MATKTPIALAALLARATSDVGASVDLGSATTARAKLLVTAAAGTLPTLAVSLQTSADGTTWRAGGDATLVEGVGLFDVLGFGLDRYVRAAWTIGGTLPIFTFSVAGASVLVYDTPAGLLERSIAKDAIASFSDDQKDKALTSASDVLSTGFNSGGYALPLVSWGDDTRQNCCDIAAFFLLKNRGFSPEGDPLIVKAYDDAKTWVNMVAREQISPIDIVDATPLDFDGGAMVVSKPKRGW